MHYLGGSDVGRRIQLNKVKRSRAAYEHCPGIKCIGIPGYMGEITEKKNQVYEDETGDKEKGRFTCHICRRHYHTKNVIQPVMEYKKVAFEGYI